MEVIYTGIRQTPEQIAEAALHEDVEAIGLSIHSGAHLDLFPRILDALRARGIINVPIYAGGIIPDADLPTVLAMGVRGVYGPGTPLDAIVQAIRDGAVAERASRGL